MKSIYAKVSAVMLISALTLSGCGSTAITNMTTEQSELIGEYAATILLKYDANYGSRLVDLSTVEEAPEVEVAPQAPEEEKLEKEENTTPVIEKGEEGQEGTVGSIQDIATVCAFPEGLEITFKEHRFADTYEDEGFEYFALEASEGKQFLVLSFDIKNTTSENQEVDVLTQNVKIKVNVNEDISKYALTTMLMNDLATYEDVLTPDEVKEVVLIIEVEDSMEQEVHSITLNAQNASNSQTIQLF